MKTTGPCAILSVASAWLASGVAIAQSAQVAAPSQQVSDWVAAAASQGKLDAGQVLLQSQFDAAQARVSVDAAVRIHAKPEVIWPLITRCDSAAILIPGLKHCRQLSQSTDHTSAVVEHDIKFAALLPIVRSVYQANYQAPYRMDFHRIAGDMKDEVGTWLLQPSADGSSTTVEYRVAMQPGFFVPHTMVRHSLKKQLPAALLALRERAEHREQSARVASSDNEVPETPGAPSADSSGHPSE
jgi:hypothetical protein